MDLAIRPFTRTRVVMIVMVVVLAGALYWLFSGRAGIAFGTHYKPVYAASDHADPRILHVGFVYPKDGLCPGSFRVDVTETKTELRLGDVIEPKPLLGDGGCAGVGHEPGAIAWISVKLDHPINGRRFIRAADGAELGRGGGPM